MKKEDFYNTKWDQSEWSEEMKTKWQEKCFELGFAWHFYSKSLHLNKYYFLSSANNITYAGNHETYATHSHKPMTWGDMFPEGQEHVDKEAWTNTHYNHNYILTEKEKEQGFVKLDAYKVAKVWKIGSKDDSGALWHTFKIFPRYGEKNSVEREIKAMYNQIKCLAEIEGVDLDN